MTKGKEPDVVDQLTHLFMLGRTLDQHADLNAAIKATSANPDEWDAVSGIPVRLWMSDVAKQLTEAVPEMIKTLEMRPADAVALLIRYSLSYGVQIGRNWPEPKDV